MHVPDEQVWKEAVHCGPGDAAQQGCPLPPQVAHRKDGLPWHTAPESHVAGTPHVEKQPVPELLRAPELPHP